MASEELLMEFGTEMSSEWRFTTSKLPENQELMATLSNGFIGHRIFSDTIYNAGVFNGNHLTSHRARIPSSLPTEINVVNDRDNDTSEKRIYTLDTKNAVFVQTIMANDKSYSILQTIYAHRFYRNLFITEVKVKTTKEGGVSVRLKNNIEKPSTDISFSSQIFKDYRIMSGSTNESEQEDVQKVDVAVVYSPANNQETIHVERSSNWKAFYYVTAISNSLESSDPKSKALEEFEKAVGLIEKDYNYFFKSHQDEWEKLWKSGNISTEGDLMLSQAINSSLYFIISSIDSSWPHGLSPGGLPSDGYMGHTFWDQATWMFPPILLFHPGLAKSCLEYRYQRLEAAKQRAKKNGYKGTMFPWESAVSGFEVCPEPDPYSKYEHHVVGDVGFAAQQYWMATHDIDWFIAKGQHLIEGVAEFWASRVVFDKTKDAFVINHIQGPDEYHYDVNNSVYTNVIAKTNLEFAAHIFSEFKFSYPPSWTNIASKMYIPFDVNHNYHPEFDGYQIKTVVKQADVILLGYPLMFNMPTDVRKNDLEIYEAYTDHNGPAMTKAMFAIGWLELKEFDKAAISFKESYANITEPFKIWTETPTGGEVNFITGAGGFLQSVLFGYGGIRLKLDGLYIEPHLPHKIDNLSFNGITYLGNKLNYFYDSEHVTIVVTEQMLAYENLVLFIIQTKQQFVLYPNKVCKFSLGRAVLRKK